MLIHLNLGASHGCPVIDLPRFGWLAVASFRLAKTPAWIAGEEESLLSTEGCTADDASDDEGASTNN